MSNSVHSLKRVVFFRMGRGHKAMNALGGSINLGDSYIAELDETRRRFSVLLGFWFFGVRIVLRQDILCSNLKTSRR